MATATAAPVLHEKFNRSPGAIGMIGFGVVLLVGVIYSAYHLLSGNSLRVERGFRDGIRTTRHRPVRGPRI